MNPTIEHISAQLHAERSAREAAEARAVGLLEHLKTVRCFSDDAKCCYSPNPIGREWGGYCPTHTPLEVGHLQKELEQSKTTIFQLERGKYGTHHLGEQLIAKDAEIHKLQKVARELKVLVELFKYHITCCTTHKDDSMTTHEIETALESAKEAGI